MFQVQKIMKDAWELYRQRTRSSRPKFLKDRRALFAHCLKNAWHWAKEKVAVALKSFEQQRAERISQIENELLTLDCRSFRYSIADERKSLVHELNQLRAMVA